MVMVNYSSMYRRYGRRATPWERYAQVSGARIVDVFDRVSAGCARPPGRALDLGCGRGMYTRELAQRGWDAVGVDAAPEAIAGAQERGGTTVRYLVGDVTNLDAVDLGGFDLFIDIGCFQGLSAQQRPAMGKSVSSLANPNASFLMLAFGWTRFRWLFEGVSRGEIDDAFPLWEIREVWPAPTAGLGWPMDRTAPQWYRMQLRSRAETRSHA
ncbi:class I SAM-dependent methyltransferase [Tessaracoccus antarcticus]|nr:class I SAM-dependent methyltransferase [Tessaracoccus antarcticus]